MECKQLGEATGARPHVHTRPGTTSMGHVLKINRSLKYACPTSQPAGSDFCRGTGGAAVPAVTRRALTGVAEAGDEAAGGWGVGGHVVDRDRSRHNIAYTNRPVEHMVRNLRNGWSHPVPGFAYGGGATH